MSTSEDPRTRAYNEYFLLSGSVFYGFGRAESSLAATLRMFVTSQMREDTGPIWQRLAVAATILGNVRYATLKDTYKRLLALQEPSEELSQSVDAVFQHMGDIQFLRDRMAHYLLKPLDTSYDGTWLSEDIAATRDFYSPKTYKFNVSALRAAFLDLKDVPVLLQDALGNPAAKPIELPAWRYKPSMLTLHRPKLADSSQ